MTARDACIYLEELGSLCPHCRRVQARIRRLIDGSQWVRVDPGGQPEIVVPCYCAGCGAEWVERYSLVSVGPIVT